VNFDPKEAGVVWVVVVRYTTGDSFGTTYGEWHVESAYETIDEANEIKKKIEEGEYKSGLGYTPWVGYFESLEGVHVERMVVDP